MKEHQKQQRVPFCATCPHNFWPLRDEYRCMLTGEEMYLLRGQKHPPWCKRREAEENEQAGSC